MARLSCHAHKLRTRPTVHCQSANAPENASGITISCNPTLTTGATSVMPSERGLSAIQTTGATIATPTQSMRNAIEIGNGQINLATPIPLQRWTCAGHLHCPLGCTGSRRQEGLTRPTVKHWSSKSPPCASTALAKRTLAKRGRDGLFGWDSLISSPNVPSIALHENDFGGKRHGRASPAMARPMN